jgi:hypothetical protein
MRIAIPCATLLGLVVTASGCAPLKPWVKPYEREHLADPIMALSPHPISTSYREHVFQTREGSRGATGGGAGGGCGCN